MVKKIIFESADKKQYLVDLEVAQLFKADNVIQRLELFAMCDDREGSIDKTLIIRFQDEAKVLHKLIEWGRFRKKHDAAFPKWFLEKNRVDVDRIEKLMEVKNSSIGISTFIASFFDSITRVDETGQPIVFSLIGAAYWCNMWILHAICERAFDTVIKEKHDQLRIFRIPSSGDCAICLNSYKDPTRIVPCGHCFCCNCLVGLFKSKPLRTRTYCPLCRVKILRCAPDIEASTHTAD